MLVLGGVHRGPRFGANSRSGGLVATCQQRPTTHPESSRALRPQNLAPSGDPGPGKMFLRSALDSMEARERLGPVCVALSHSERGSEEE